MQGRTLSQRTRVRAPAPRGAPPTGLRSTSVATSTHRSRPAHRRAGADQRLSQATHFMAFIGAAAFMAFLAKPFASAFPTFMAFIAAAFMAFLAKVPFASAFTTFMAFIAAAFMAFLAKPFASAFTTFMAFIAGAAAFMAFLAKVPFAWVFTAFIAFIAGAAAFFIAFAMARREVDEDTGTTQST